MARKACYKRVLIKVSGEALAGKNKGIDFGSLDLVANEIKKLLILVFKLPSLLAEKYF